MPPPSKTLLLEGPVPHSQASEAIPGAQVLKFPSIFSDYPKMPCRLLRNPVDGFIILAKAMKQQQQSSLRSFESSSLIQREGQSRTQAQT